MNDFVLGNVCNAGTKVFHSTVESSLCLEMLSNWSYCNRGLAYFQGQWLAGLMVGRVNGWQAQWFIAGLCLGRAQVHVLQQHARQGCSWLGMCCKYIVYRVA